MTVIASGLSTYTTGTLMSCQGQIYYANNYDPVKVWDGVSATMANAGMTGPAAVLGAPTTAAGGFDNGAHQIRYRYKNSKTGYVSNPSIALNYTVAGGLGLLTFTPVASADSKCDTIIFEATPVNSGNFYQCATTTNSATGLQFGMADTLLVQQFNSDSEYGSSENLETYTAEPPPIGTICTSYKGRMWVFGDVAFPVSAATFTNGSPTVTAVTPTPSTKMIGKVIRGGTDTTAYFISNVVGTTITLSVNYTGTGGTKTASIYSSTPNRGYYSRTFYPEQFYAAVWARDFLANRADHVTAVSPREDALYVFGLYSTDRIIYNSDPSAAAGAVILPIQGRRGAFNQRCIVDVDGTLYAWDRQGMYLVSRTPVQLSNPIIDTISDLIDFTYSANFHASFDPVERVVMFFFTRIGDTTTKYAFCFDIDDHQWWVNAWAQAITASAVMPSSDGQVRLALADANGYQWYFGVYGGFDGTPPTTTAVVTASVAGTTTTASTVEVLPSAPYSLLGVSVYRPLSGETSFVTAATTSSMTWSPAMATAVGASEKLYLGAIAYEYKTKWWVGSGQENVKSPLFLVIKLFPGSSSGLMRVYIYADFQSNPVTVTANSSDTWPGGVTVTNGNGYIDIALSGNAGDGLISVPINASYSNALQARLTSIKPDGALRLLDFGFMSGKDEEASDVGN